MSEHVHIARRFCGPPESGNGGYVCGVLAGYVDGSAEVTLRKPPPLERELVVQQPDADTAVLLDGDVLVAEAKRIEPIDITPVAAPSLAEAAAAVERYPGFDEHAFPTCFVCGPEREPHDALCIFPGALGHGTTGVVAAPWTPAADLGDASGHVRPEFLWAALDCPGGFSFTSVPKFRDKPAVLGRLAARLDAPVSAGEPYVVAGWMLGEDGRKWFSGTALYTAAGDLCAVARATWIAIA